MDLQATADELLRSLAARADPDFAARMQRYFPQEIRAFGVSNAVVTELAHDYFRRSPEVSAATRLLLAEEVLSRADHHEEVLLGFALLCKVAKTGLPEDFLDRCENWLGVYVSNWAQCDDLCLKLLYPFLCSHLDQIPQIRRWVESESVWTRRAANVAVVKFIRRKVGRATFELPLAHVFDNCTRLMRDEDVYVQKGCGWLLKVAAEVHPVEVTDFLRQRHAKMNRATFRYAIEKLDPQTRASLLALR
jgi:3-methyladenine DNA glycosylase AlkD